ncbi:MULTISPECIES: O-antigen ligase [unclassified Rhodococcus (in: high G+C Gram-positive bacteria)]|uniref:O-antigen ligase family protein n=1 Tax=unclassified Rhodococcus (in: high G+C Gram-positive bacteria) TaxID=192944 RepID=UPI000B9A7AC0|nr:MULTISPECIES: O-antigen ligase family protein [unclassified Rhodococcus (in: high G+C Gram-positive bacteria)]OZE34092.1 hypothetical protein CH259_18865 [Rhodococcus sp. 05-2254-4]OZE51290.1 hypothetical protein CH261_01550 [Rhodococcus sp. 05-2254-3]OZE52941.1 hypothetical protein CH283_06640 [Rhodococcus sp. 05-2254-2]
MLALVALLLLLAATPTKLRTKLHAAAIGGSAVLTSLQVANVHVFTLLTFGWVILHLSRRTTFTTPMALLLLASALVASSVVAGDLVGNPRLAVQLALLVLSALSLAMYSTQHERLVMAKGALTVITISGGYGVGQLVGLFPSRAGLVHLDISAVGRPSGLWPEPDWLGMYCAVGILLAWHLPIKRWQRAIALPMCTVMWVLAFARGAWVALVATVIIATAANYLWRKYRDQGQATHRRTAIAITLIGATTLLYFLPALTNDLLIRLQRTIALDSEDVSGQARIQQTQGLFALADESPWYGRGLSAAGRVGVSGKLYLDESSNSVASNWIFGLWVDSRWLAVPFVALIIGLLFVSVRSLAGQITSVVAISSLFSNATYMPIFWFGLALTLAWLATQKDKSSQKAGLGADAQNVEQAAEPPISK